MKRPSQAAEVHVDIMRSTEAPNLDTLARRLEFDGKHNSAEQRPNAPHDQIEARPDVPEMDADPQCAQQQEGRLL